MKKVIFIVHHSEIIRRGFYTILRSFFLVEIIQLQTLSGLLGFIHIKKNHILLFTEMTDDPDFSFVNRLGKHNLINLIGITNDSENTVHPYDHLINLSAAADEIQRLVSSLFHSDTNEQRKKSSDTELTVREREVLKLVALGHANKEIADILFISIHTIISHRKNITEKLGIKSISGLTVYAILNKIIDTDTMNPEQLI